MHWARALCPTVHAKIYLCGHDPTLPPSLQCTQEVMVKLREVSLSLVGLICSLATECELGWNLFEDGVQVTGSSRSINRFRSELDRTIIEHATSLARETATISTVLSVLSCLTSLEELSRHLNVSCPNKGRPSERSSILRLLEELYAADEYPSQEKLGEALSKMGRPDLAQKLSSARASGRLLW